MLSVRSFLSFLWRIFHNMKWSSYNNNRRGWVWYSFYYLYSAQYSNLVGTIGRTGKHGPFTLYIEDAKTFFLDEDLPAKYERRELPFYTPEGAAYLDRMSQHIGFTIERPFPPNDADGRDVEPEVANYERGHWCLGSGGRDSAQEAFFRKVWVSVSSVTRREPSNVDGK